MQDAKLGEVMMPGMPLRFSDFVHNPPLDAVSLGENNAQVLREVLGYAPARIAELSSAGVLFANPDT